jgi:hypothetical protein
MRFLELSVVKLKWNTYVAVYKQVFSLYKAVELTPPFKYKEKPYEGILPDINEAAADFGEVPDKVDKFPRVGQIPKLPPLPSIVEQEGGTCDWLVIRALYHVTFDWSV